MALSYFRYNRRGGWFLNRTTSVTLFSTLNNLFQHFTWVSKPLQYEPLNGTKITSCHNGDSTTTSSPASGPSKQFHISRVLTNSHYDIRTGDGKSFDAGIRIDGITLRLGSNKDSPIIAKSYKPFLSGNIMIGLDPEDPEIALREEVKREASIINYR